MEIVFWSTSFLSILFILFHIVGKKDYFSILTYTLLGFYLPLFMSFCNWSSYSIQDKGSLFYYICTCVNIACSIYCILPAKSFNKVKSIRIVKNVSKIPIEFINLFYIACVLVENVYLSGFLFPSLAGIDVHTGRMPGIYFITTAVYIVVVADFLEFLATKKKRYLIYATVSFSINVISKFSRVDAGIASIQVGSLLLSYFLSKHSNTKALGKKFLVLFLCACTVFFLANKGIEIGNNRMNKNGRYSLVYSKGLGYTGPESDNELLAYYYGYFPMSFDNLAYNLQHVQSNFNGIGLNSFRALYFGILQFDNFLGLDGGEAVKNKIVRCKAAAVPTIFWDFYYDYDILVFIPILVTFSIAYYLMKQLVDRQSVTSLIIYFYWVPLWMFGSFDNRSYDYQVIWHILMMYFLFRHRYQMGTAMHQISGNVPVRRKPKFRIGRIRL